MKAESFSFVAQPSRGHRMKMKELVKKVIADQRSQTMEEIKELKKQKIILEQEEIEKQNIRLQRAEERMLKQKKRRQENFKFKNHQCTEEKKCRSKEKKSQH